MPIMRITIAEGATPGQKAELFHRVTEAAHDAFAADYDKIRIVLIEVPAEHMAIGGKISDPPEPSRSAAP